MFNESYWYEQTFLFLLVVNTLFLLLRHNIIRKFQFWFGEYPKHLNAKELQVATHGI